jgi:hypothetical protein
VPERAKSSEAEISVDFSLNSLYFPASVGGQVPAQPKFGGVPEWLKGADCKSAGDAFEGSNPSPTTILRTHLIGAHSFSCDLPNLTYQL